MEKEIYSREATQAVCVLAAPSVGLCSATVFVQQAVPTVLFLLVLAPPQHPLGAREGVGKGGLAFVPPGFGGVNRAQHVRTVAQQAKRVRGPETLTPRRRRRRGRRTVRLSAASRVHRAAIRYRGSGSPPPGIFTVEFQAEKARP